MSESASQSGDGNIDPDFCWRDDDRVVFRGWRDGDTGQKLPVLRVLPEAEHSAPATLQRLAHEFALRDILQRSWAVLPLELVHEHGRPVLLLEDPGGEPLEHLLGTPLPLERCLRLAIGIADALASMRQCGLIHKDIRPLNILVGADDVGADDRAVRLTGFGIASRMPREQLAAAPAEAIDGTLAYMAPEQTGRMNCSVDARSDLYAFGITLYRMLTGALPFTSDDPMELVHCHMARCPPPPDAQAPGVPQAVADIVMKLLAKTPEERYQTALGVAADLRHCLDAWRTAGRIEQFRPGRHDIADTPRIPEHLYGRDREVRALLDAFNRVLTRGTPELALVSGYSGIGKTSVVNELHRLIVPSRGLFASAKFEQHKRNVPYATLAGALQVLVRQLLVKREDELPGWREAISASLGANAGLVIQLVPELERLIGPQPPVTPLPASEADSRFRAVLIRFLGVFARPEHPLVLFLDDLQWLDAATLGFLGDVVSPPTSLHLLVIGAYRSNKVGPGHPLTQMLDAVRAAGAAVQEVALGPLSGNDMRWMVSETAGCDEATAEPLARLMLEKTGGNPFFAILFLTLLNEEGLFAFDPAQRGWRWDIDAIRAKGFTENVVEQMAGRLTRLPAGPRSQQLDVASVIKASQAISGEIVLPQLIQTVMSLALENAGADRGLLILPRDDGWCIAATAIAGNRKTQVTLQSAEMDQFTCPEMLLRYVIRTHASVAVDDDATPHLFAEDPYLRHRRPRSMLAVPIIRNGVLTGVLYLENSLASRVFAPDRTALLEVLAAQAAISLENARLYSEVREREEKLRRIFDSSIIGILITRAGGKIIDANDAFLDMVGYSRADLRNNGLRWTELTPPEWLPLDRQALRELTATGSCKPFEKEYIRKDGTRVPILLGAAAFDAPNEGVAFVLDITERKRAEEERQANLWFLESMDRVNRAIQSTNDLEQMMSNALETVLAIFGSDRAWLMYPCDPAAPTSRVVQEHTRPGFPGAFALGADLPVSAGLRGIFQATLAANGAVRLGAAPGYHPLAPPPRRFGVLSAIAMAIYPRRDRPYLFGLHQCSSERVWTRQEERLFQEIGHRLTDALTSLLAFRDMQESEARLEEAQRIAHVGHWECDPATLRVQWSDEIYRIFGMTPQERPIFFGETARMSQEDHNAVMRALHEALHRGAPYNKEFRAIRPDGEVRIVRSIGHVVRDASGQPRHMFGTMQDITEHRRAESLTRQVFESLPDAVCIIGRDYRLRQVNRIYEQSRGLPAEQLRGRHIKDIPEFEATFEPSIKPRLDRCFAGEEGRYTDWADNALGRRYRVITYSPLRLETAQVEAALLISRDLTEHMLAEEALREAQMELAHANRVTTMGQLTASIAHEINQPITAAVTNAHAALRWLAARPPDLEEVRQALSRIVNDSSRAGEIIGRIRGLIRKLPPRNDWLDITETIREVITLTRGELQRNNVVLHTDLARGLPAIRGDRVQLQQVVLNLIVNAIEAMRSVADNARSLWITTAHGPEGVVVAVRDSGTGVPPDEVSQLFEAFFTTKSGGMGMGLSICRSIIEAHAGRIWANGSPQGAVFQFVLPIHKEQTA